MEWIEYIIQKGDNLESIANKHNINSKDLLDFHNSNVPLTQQFYGSEIPFHITEIKIPIIENKVEEESINNVIETEQNARYRCEQTVIMKLNGIVHSHADTKREFLVSKSIDTSNIIVKTELVENVIEAYQKQLELAIKLVCEIDTIKSNLKVNLKKDGKINKILNHKEIIKNWNEKKGELESDFSFLRDKKTHQDFKNFLKLNDEQFNSQENLINDLNSKMFFDVFFDKYLTSENFLDNYSRTYYSQLFDGYGVNLHFNQDILAESPNQVEVRKVSSFSKSDLDNGFLEKQYDFKFKPIVKYKFSEYNFSVRERSIINTKDRWIEQSDITIIEEVKNNVQVLIDYKLRKIE